MSHSLARITRSFLSILAIGCVLFSVSPKAATGTLMPSPYQTVLDTNGNPVNGAKVCTYLAGTTTPTATYTDSALTVPNGNPIVADSSGRFVAFLSLGASYKFIYQDASGTANTCNGVVLKTVDNVSAVPASSANTDIPGTAGEALTAGLAAYLSAGDGGKTQGQWYKADSANTYSSVNALIVAMVPTAIASGASGTFRVAGQMTGLTTTIGSTYYIGTAGAITATAPGNTRIVGKADTTSTLDMAANPGVPIADNAINDFRLTLTTGVPVTTSDVTAATTLFCTPAGHGNRLALFDSAGIAAVYTSAEFSIAVPATTSQTYDIFAYSNSGVPTLELLAWTNDTTRATAIVLTTTGVYTKSGDLTRRYLGSFRTTGVSGQTEDSIAKRYVWNYYNRAERPMRVIDAAASWAYTTNTLRQANANAANQLDFVLGVQEDVVIANVMANASDTTGGVFIVGIGLDSTSTIATGETAGMGAFTANSIPMGVSAMYRSFPGVGRHTLVWLEAVVSGTSTTWYGTSKYQTGNSAGISGTIKG